MKIGTLRKTGQRWGARGSARAGASAATSHEVDHAWTSADSTACGKVGRIGISAPATVTADRWVTCKSCRKALGL